MLHILTHKNWCHHQELLTDMYRERKRVFVDLLRWNIGCVGDLEIDQFDGVDARYLVVADDHTGRHLGSVRLLPTMGDHLLFSLFPHLCAAAVPRGEDIFEITRLCLSRALRATTRLKVRNELATGLVEYGLQAGIKSYTGVAEIGWLSQILSFGWDCKPLGLPVSDASGQIGALQIFIDAESSVKLAAAGTYAPIAFGSAPGVIRRAA